ncbi:hypothetical protein [Roseateles microcysteis]|uniref:hypothetical protein n=2 Tax=Roseateles TaxID=93681 RepID=UPI002FE574AC
MSGRLSRGFGLLEAIVALAILGSTGLVLIAWINQNIVTATQIKEAEARAQIQLETQAWLAVLNPALEPKGERQLGELKISWESELVEPMRDEFSFTGAFVPRWRLGLYRVKARASRSEVNAEWQQLVAGWQERADAPAVRSDQ